MARKLLMTKAAIARRRRYRATKGTKTRRTRGGSLPWYKRGGEMNPAKLRTQGSTYNPRREWHKQQNAAFRRKIMGGGKVAIAEALAKAAKGDLLGSGLRRKRRVKRKRHK